MRVERVVDGIYVFLSDLYLRVTSTVFVTEEGAVVVDTLPFPEETRQVISFVEDELGPGRIRYVINTHHHADHVYGNWLFEGAEVIAHDKCREMLARFGERRLGKARRQTPELAEVQLRLPGMTFGQEMRINLGGRKLNLFHTPGNSPDGISVFEEGDQVLIAGDAIMPVPYIVNGNIDQLRASLLHFQEMEIDFTVQGHGHVLLRGETQESIESSLSYLTTIVEKVRELVEDDASPEKLVEIDIESCGKSRIPLDGMVSKLHQDNLRAVYGRLRAQQA
ncbi:MAG: MBL fold metallo-hydrolase [Chloroflexota bacterium]|nr:MBL fold metallo-hydrolase [Chloroflexota bacterium]